MQCGRRQPYFLSRKTGHPAAEGFRPVLICNGSLDPRMVIGEKLYEGKRYIICLADLRMENPPAKHLYRNLLTQRKEQTL